MPIPFFQSIDLNKNELQNAKVQNLASDPGTPTAGQIYHNTVSGTLKQYTGSTWVTLGRLDQITAPTGDVDLNSNKITNLADPGADTDAVNKRYADSIAQGIDGKASVKAATTANITLTGAQTIDGVALVADDRCLVKNQSTASQNGIYVVAAGAWARATDMDHWSEVPGAFTFVEQGTTQADTGWLCSADTGGTIGSTAMAWVQFSQAGVITASNKGTTTYGVFAGKVGNDLQFKSLVIPANQGAVTLSQDANHVTVAASAKIEALHDQATSGIIVQTGAATFAARSITTAAAGLTTTNGDGVAGNISIAPSDDLAAVEALATTGIVRRTGTNAWSAGTTVSVAEGGTGSTTAAAARVALAAPRYYVANVGATASGAVTVTHSMGTRDVEVQVYRIAAPYDTIYCDVERTDTNTVTLRFGADYAINTFRIIVIGVGV